MDIHLITLNIPYPPDYGGMIDSFYRIRALHSLGVKIHLHCFEYGREHSKELELYCETVRYYPRKTGLLSQFSLMPYIVSSRKSGKLLENLRKDNYPIFFDGLHTTYYINHPALSGRKKLVRLHNIEHLYYNNLAENEPNLFKKIFFILEKYRLNLYEKVLDKADQILVISEGDRYILKEKYKNIVLSHPFHQFSEIMCLPGKGDYVIWHGDLSVAENSLIADSLIHNIFSKIPYQCVIAGKNPPDKLKSRAKQFSNIRVVSDPDEETMTDLIRNAQVNLLPSKSTNGFKLKIISALFAGRHCLVNSLVAEAYPSIEHLCNVADTDEEVITRLHLLMKETFSEEIIQERKELLIEHFDVIKNAKKLKEAMF